MLLLVSSLVLCACANDLAVGEITAAPSHLVNKACEGVGVGRYFVDPLVRTWSEASKFCRSFNGHLAFPETAEELVVLKNIKNENNFSRVHIGFHDLTDEGQYITVKDQLFSELDYNVAWAVGQPDNSNLQNCGGLYDNGMHDVFCYEKNPSICEENDPLSEGGSLGYQRVGPYGLFKMVPILATWLQAYKLCRDQGAHLWIINSADERSAVFDHFNTKYNLWIGAHHLCEDKFFVTIFDDSLEDLYSTWTRGQPSGNNTVYPYVAANANGLSIQTSDRQFICEFNPPH